MKKLLIIIIALIAINCDNPTQPKQILVTIYRDSNSFTTLRIFQNNAEIVRASTTEKSILCDAGTLDVKKGTVDTVAYSFDVENNKTYKLSLYGASEEE